MAAERRQNGPEGLSEAGRRLWGLVTRDFDLGAAEQHVLLQACRTADVIVRLDETVAGLDDLVVSGSKGQPALHPAVVEARHQRLALSRLLAQLQLPDDVGGTVLPSPLQVRGREAAAKRWGSRGA